MTMESHDGLKLLVFDFDGTLVDSLHNITRAMRAAFAATGLPYPGDDATRRQIGLSLREAVAALAPDGASDALIDAATEAYKETAFAIRNSPDFHEPLFPGARQMLDALHGRDDVFLSIATGKARRGLEPLLERLDIGHLFAVTQTADDAPSKPHPGMLLNAMERLGMEAANTILIGDTVHDMRMAKNAAVTPIGVAWGHHEPDHLLAEGARDVAGDFNHLHDMIESFFQRGRRP